MNNSKTILCDIDGTLVKHGGNVFNYTLQNKFELLEDTTELINTWDRLGYNIILITGRKESLRNTTEKHLQEVGIVYDKLIMGVGNGDRVLINDKKKNSNKNTSYCLNVNRDKGLLSKHFNSINLNINDQPKFVVKPWGSEELIEYNDNYVVKKLCMNKNESCSLQYHELKKETIYVVSGKLKLLTGKDINNLEEKILVPNDFINIEQFVIHKLEGIEDSVYIECSTNELWDVVRLEDKYNRSNITEQDYK